MKKPLTPSQQAVFEFIKRFVADNQFPPTCKEIAAGMQFRSPNAAAQFLRALAAKDYIARLPNTARGIRVL